MPQPVTTRFSREDFASTLDALGARADRREPTTAEGVRLVREGLSIGVASAPPEARAAATERAYRLDQWRDEAETWHAVNDRIGLDIHGRRR